MQPSKLVKKHMNRILSAACILALMIFVGCKFDYYYELNDDVLIKDILAGVYTGMPEGHNIQMLWPLSAVLSLFYRMAQTIPWYGLFLCGIHYLCAYLILERSLGFVRAFRAKLMIAGITLILIVGLFLEHLVFAHYTITAALMMATAAYMFYTLPGGLSVAQFIRKSILSVVLIAVAYCLRPNMSLLLLPLIGVTGVIRWSREDKPFQKDNLVRYLTVIGMILLSMGICYGADAIAYSSPQWKAFNTLFDNRTQLYDFQVIPSYEEHESFYQSIDMKKSEQELLVKYNYGLDPAIDEVVIGEVASYAKEMKGATFAYRLKEAVKQYIYRSFHEEDYPWNLINWMIYLALFLTILMRKNTRFLISLRLAVFRLGLIFFVRSGLWMYILVNGRCPVRISHSLYLMELCVLVSLLIVEYTRKLREKSFIILITGCFFLCAFLIMIPYRVTLVTQKCEMQKQVDSYGKAIDGFCKARLDRFYYLDVYSTIIGGMSFSDKMFDHVDNTYENHDLLGGWSCNSPLYRKKLSQMGLNGPYQDLTDSKITYLISELSAPIDWLTNFYEDEGIEVIVNQVDNIDGYYGVYQIEKVGN